MKAPSDAPVLSTASCSRHPYAGRGPACQQAQAIAGHNKTLASDQISMIREIRRSASIIRARDCEGELRRWNRRGERRAIELQAILARDEGQLEHAMRKCNQLRRARNWIDDEIADLQPAQIRLVLL